MRHVTRMVAVLLAFTLFVGLGAALEANIQPSSPDDITLDGDNAYEVSKQFDGTASTGDITSYTWDLVGSGQSDTGPQATFDFDRDSSGSSTVRLTVSNTTHSDVDEVTQVVHDVPEATISADGSTSINEGGSVSFSIDSTTNAFDGPLSYDWTVDGTSEGSGESFSHTFSSSGSYDVELVATDQAGEVGTSNTVTVSVSTSDDGGDGGGGGGGSSGGGGGGALGGPPNMVEIFNDVRPGAVVNVQVDRNETFGVSGISLSVTTPSNITVTVTKQDGRPANVTVNASDHTYRYLNIEADGVNASSLENASIDFVVNQSWINDRGVDAEDVVLHRWNEDAWQALPTELEDGTGGVYTYRAETPGFSYFAVAAENDTKDTTQDPVCGDGTCNGDETWETCSQDCPVPTEVQDAQDALQTANQSISESDAGYETLQEAYTAYDAGNYTEASSLAEQAQDEYTAAQGMNIPWMPIVVVLLLAVLVAVLYTQRERIQAAVQGEEKDVEDPLGPVRTDN